MVLYNMDYYCNTYILKHFNFIWLGLFCYNFSKTWFERRHVLCITI